MRLEIFPEMCCDYCQDIVHNHFDCPACKKSWASTNRYCDLYEEEHDQRHGHLRGDFVLSCEECGAKFRLIPNEEWKPLDEWEWEALS